MPERFHIDHVGQRGDGVTADGAFIAYTLPGEIVLAEPDPGHADRRTLVSVETPSPDRIAPICRHFGVCGGCATQHWTSSPYLDWKRDLVAGALAHAGIETVVDATIDAHGDGRRRVVFHARRGADRLDVGFAAPRAHWIVPIEECPVLVPGLAGAIGIARAIAAALEPLAKPLDLHVTAADNGLDVDIRGSGPLPPPRAAALARLASELRLARLTRHGELVAQSVQPTLRMGKAQVPLPPGSFLQATRMGEETLARLVCEHAAPAKRVADLFCGVGPFALRLAERASVAAFDSDAGAIDALTSASRAQGLKPIVAAKRDLFRTPLTVQELAAFDTVVFDPPRQGAEAQARVIAAAKAKRVIAVSCNAATFARDARLLIDGGYRLKRVTPVDQFRYSAHVELVALFMR